MERVDIIIGSLHIGSDDTRVKPGRTLNGTYRLPGVLFNENPGFIPIAWLILDLNIAYAPYIRGEKEMKILLMISLTILNFTFLWGQDIIGISKIDKIESREGMTSIKFKGITIKLGINVNSLNEKLGVNWIANENEKIIIAEGSNSRLSLKYNDSLIYEISVDYTSRVLIKEFEDYDDNDLNILIGDEDAATLTLEKVFTKWGRPDYYENIGELMYSIKNKNLIIILKYNMYGKIIGATIINRNYLIQ